MQRWHYHPRSEEPPQLPPAWRKDWALPLLAAAEGKEPPERQKSAYQQTASAASPALHADTRNRSGWLEQDVKSLL
jgi:hypothetical protein